MATFSINTGTTETVKYDLIQTTDLDYILTTLHDNTSKEISPISIRNAILSAASNVAFKETNISYHNLSYIGIDSLNPLNRGVSASKILLGKREYNNNEILETTLLNSDTDIFLYNTKLDSISNNRTRIPILSGTNSSLYSVAPYLQSQVVVGTTQSILSLDIVNPSLTGGDINFTSDYGTISVNNITFPDYSPADTEILFWQSGVLSWDQLTYTTPDYVGVTGSITNIYGSPVNVNNYSLDFTDTRECPIAIGDITLGSTFTSIGISEMLRRIIYTYLPPQCSISILPPYSSGYVEVGSSPLVKLNYTITKRTLPTVMTGLANMIPGSYPAISLPGEVVVSGTSSGVIISPVLSATTSFTVTVGDGTQSNSAFATVTGIYPYFHGFSSLSTMTTAGLASLTKLVESQGDKTIDVSGSGNFYFIYDSSYPDLTIILNESSTDIFATFSQSLKTLSSPTGLWASKQFKVYQWSGVSQIGPPSVNYQFKY